MAYWSGGRASAAITALLTAVPAPSAKHQSACLSSLPGCLSLFFSCSPLLGSPTVARADGEIALIGVSPLFAKILVSCLILCFFIWSRGYQGVCFGSLARGCPRFEQVRWDDELADVWLKCGVVLEGRRLLYNVSGIWNLYRLFRTLNVTRWLDMRFNRTFKSFPRVARKYIRLLYNVAINYTKCCKKAIPVIKQAAHSLKVPVKVPGIFRRN